MVLRSVGRASISQIARATTFPAEPGYLNCRPMLEQPVQPPPRNKRMLWPSERALKFPNTSDPLSWRRQSALTKVLRGCWKLTDPTLRGPSDVRAFFAKDSSSTSTSCLRLDDLGSPWKLPFSSSTPSRRQISAWTDSGAHLNPSGTSARILGPVEHQLMKSLP